MRTGESKYRLFCLLASLGALLAVSQSAIAQIALPPIQPANPAIPARPLPAGPSGFLPTGRPPLTTQPTQTIAPTQTTAQSVPIQRNQVVQGELKVESNHSMISIFARDVDLRLVLGHLAEESQVNIVIAENVDARVTTTLNNVPLWSALDAILRINGLVWTQKEEIIFVTRPGGGLQSQASAAQGLSLQVFDLNYTSGAEVLEVVKGLLSPSGKAFLHAVDKASSRQTRERIVVEDYPDRLEAISQYLAGVDNPPLQVLIEAHVLQVTLTDDQRHGVNLTGLMRMANGHVNVRTQGFANGDANPGFMLGLESTDLDGMVEALCSNSNTRTLAAPKVLVVNGQEARIQIGSRFGYFVTTTTQTSSLQSVNFLDIGVLLQVQPTITHDGQVMLMVSPKVSGGRINPDSGLPEEETTEAHTTVLLPDGKGMIIGGLIKESDAKNDAWVPWLGKMPVIKHLFRRSKHDSSRNEVIIALTPHIVPFSEQVNCRELAAFNSLSDTAGVVTQNSAPLIYAVEPYANLESSQLESSQLGLIENPWQAEEVSTFATVPDDLMAPK